MQGGEKASVPQKNEQDLAFVRVFPVLNGILTLNHHKYY